MILIEESQTIAVNGCWRRIPSSLDILAENQTVASALLTQNLETIAQFFV